jgi:hypothetical protein
LVTCGVIYDYEPHINVLFIAAQIRVNCRKPEAEKMNEVITRRRSNYRNTEGESGAIAGRERVTNGREK